jgi:hypothetical protein
MFACFAKNTEFFLLFFSVNSVVSAVSHRRAIVARGTNGVVKSWSAQPFHHTWLLFIMSEFIQSE